jgi:hypothetical protein
MKNNKTIRNSSPDNTLSNHINLSQMHTGVTVPLKILFYLGRKYIKILTQGTFWGHPPLFHYGKCFEAVS